MFSEKRLLKELTERNEKGLLRSLKTVLPDKIDFSSNDYLGFSHSGLLRKKINELHPSFSSQQYGAGGSRLLSGNNAFYEETEDYLAAFYGVESALIFNSGYDANLGFYSAVPGKDDIVFCDELVHASIHDGLRMGFARVYKFRHNDVEDLLKKTSLQDIAGRNVFVAVESVYSMDGDMAPLKELAELCAANNFALVVDEAHAVGVFGKQGRGLCAEMGIADKVFARLFTFGKALGAHGACIAGSKTLKQYLINFCRPFIFSTSLPHDSLVSIRAAHQLLASVTERGKLMENIRLFSELTSSYSNVIKSVSAIQAVIVEGNERVTSISDELYTRGFDVRAVRSPAVRAGTERLRINLHAFNTTNEINRLVAELGSLSVLKS